MVVAATLILFLCIYCFDFRPLFARRRELKGMWLYILMTAAAFVILIMIGFGVKLDLSWIFFQ